MVLSVDGLKPSKTLSSNEPIFIHFWHIASTYSATVRDVFLQFRPNWHHHFYNDLPLVSLLCPIVAFLYCSRLWGRYHREPFVCSYSLTLPNELVLSVQFQSHASAVGCNDCLNNRQVSAVLCLRCLSSVSHVRSNYCLKRLLMLVYQHAS